MAVWSAMLLPPPLRGRGAGGEVASMPGRVVLAVAFITFAGCARDQDYFDVAKDKQAAMDELVEILESIKDVPSMEQAKKTVKTNAEKYAEISRRAQALPNPPPVRVQEKFRQDSFLMEATIRRLGIEARRVSELPGGADFLKQFESTRGLLSAVQK